MKKVLALVLVVALMTGFATIAGATDFTDDADISHAEAIEVMEMIGVINGYPDGSFRPDGNVTRAQMAKMVATIVAGGDDVGDLYAGANAFSDCTTHWARGYIAYANHTGIIAGVGNGRFNPDGNVTGAQAAKMMLCALGYNQDTEGYTGTGWSVNVLADARTVGLLDGIEDADMNAALSRENAAQLMFNALQTPMVEYARGSIVVEGGGSTVTIGGSEAEIRQNLKFDYADGIPNYLEMCEEYFPDLNKVSASSDEDFNRPSHKWELDNASVGPFVDEAAYVYTAKTDAKDVTNDLKGYEFAYSVASDGTVRSAVRVISNDPNHQGDIVRNGADIAAYTGYGTTVEVYTTRVYNDSNNTSYREVTDVVVIAPKSGTLSIRNYAATSTHGAYELYTVGTESGRVYTSVVNEKNDVDNVVLHGNIADGALVTYYVDRQDNLHLCATSEITGVLSAVGSDGKLVIDGETYYKSTAATGDFDPAKSEQTFAVDSLGYIVKTVEGTAADRYGMILDVVTAFQVNDSNIGTTSPALVVATSSGTVETLILDMTKAQLVSAGIIDASDNVLKPLVKYTAKDDKYTVVAATGTNVKTLDEISNSADGLKNGGSTCGQYASNTTLYVFANYTDDEPNGTVTTYTGYSKVSTYKSINGAWAVDTDSTLDGIANVVFVYDDVAASGTDDFVYVKGTTSTVVGGVAYDVIVKGEETTMVVDSTSPYLNAGSGTLYSEITITNSVITGATVAAPAYKSVRNFGGVVTAYTGAGGAGSAVTYKIADTAPVYFIDTTANEPGETLTAADLERDDYLDADGIYLSLNDDGDAVLAIYVLYK